MDADDSSDYDHYPPRRPLKRARKSAAPRSQGDLDHHQFIHTPIEHIFIPDGMNAKKNSAKAPLSCCECRRLKLKCDRSFPCMSCKKRGCAEICPDGVLVSGKGTRFILANTEQLHTKIHEMSERIRSLEHALQTLHAEHTADPEQPHTLMQPVLLGIKSTMALYNMTGAHASLDVPSPTKADVSHAESDVTMVERGSSEETAAATPQNNISPIRAPPSEEQQHLAAEIVRLSHNFPLSDTVALSDSDTPESNPHLREYVRRQLPPREEADYLWEQARLNALWQYNPHPLGSTFFHNLAYHCYYSDIADLSPQRLALMFMILAVGTLVDLTSRTGTQAQIQTNAEKYHRLARACLSQAPIMEETNVETITTLFYEIWYLLIFSDKAKAAAYAWGLMGLTAKLAQSIGLHRHGGRAKVIPEEVEKRRSLFWELLYLDARLSLSTGRPPSLPINHMDCPRPSYIPDDRDIHDNCKSVMGENSDSGSGSESLHWYQEWKHSCYIQCLAPVLDLLSQASPAYESVLELDGRIRNFGVSPLLRLWDTEGQGRGKTRTGLSMQRASVSMAIEAVLLQLHRQFFTRALSLPEEAFNRRHRYAPSVIAVFLSASRMIASLQEVYRLEPVLSSRMLGFWGNAFSAAVALCLLVSRAPFTCLSPAILHELERARILFRSAKDTCSRALLVWPVLDTMIDKANDIYTRWSSGQELATIILRHNTNTETEAETVDTSSYAMGTHSGDPSFSAQGSVVVGPVASSIDPFGNAHPDLEQCIAEVHELRQALFPELEACQCSAHIGSAKPSCSSRTTKPAEVQRTRVLPAIIPGFSHLRTGGAGTHWRTPDLAPFRSGGVHGDKIRDGSGMRSRWMVLSTLAGVDSVNFELGALSSDSLSFF